MQISRVAPKFRFIYSRLVYRLFQRFRLIVGIARLLDVVYPFFLAVFYYFIQFSHNGRNCAVRSVQMPRRMTCKIRRIFSRRIHPFTVRRKQALSEIADYRVVDFPSVDENRVPYTRSQLSVYYEIIATLFEKYLSVESRMLFRSVECILYIVSLNSHRIQSESVERYVPV